jgi:hypothetical protein
MIDNIMRSYYAYNENSMLDTICHWYEVWVKSIPYTSPSTFIFILLVISYAFISFK